MTHNQQYPPNPQQPPKYVYRAAQPKKQRKWLPWTVGSVSGLIVGLAIGAAPSSNSAPDAAPQPTVTVTAPGAKVTVAPKTSVPPPAKTTAPKPAGTACAGQDDRNAPCTVTVGKPFELGKHTVLSGWKTVDEYGTLSITGKAKNTSGETSTMFIDVKFLKGDDVLAVVSCSTNELEPGQTQALSCFGTDNFTKKYDRVTAEASF